MGDVFKRSVIQRHVVLRRVHFSFFTKYLTYMTQCSHSQLINRIYYCILYLVRHLHRKYTNLPKILFLGNFLVFLVMNEADPRQARIGSCE